MKNQFTLVTLKPQVQKSKRGLDITIQPLTKQAIVDVDGKVVAYIPDHSQDGTGEYLTAKLNGDRKFKLG